MFVILSYGMTVTQANQLASGNGPISQDSNMTPVNPSADPGSFWSEQIKAHCLDSNGTMHGLFSTWTEYPDCHCTCYPNARLAVSVCDGCVVGGSRAGQIKTDERKPIARSGDRVGRGQLVIKSDVDRSVGPRIAENVPDEAQEDEMEDNAQDASRKTPLKHRGK
ncbi:unnamed protein product [Echinostoma caproni]|uniref:CVNH domain-containing protein n=1 Tax=Echinostoma caproni TaxID=27848 RepID=A0A183A6L3_9TREM|nr:unnamed protein product [Echinostoma caproni]